MGLLRFGRRALHHDALTQLETRSIVFFRDPALWWNSRRSNDCKDSATPSSSFSSEAGKKTRSQSTEQEKQKNTSQFIAALKHCSKTRDLEAGKQLHEDTVKARLHRNKYVAGVLITMYSKCRSMALAQQVFDSMNRRDVVAWTSLILGYVENGESMVALNLFTSMDCEADSVTYLAALKACGALASERPLEKQLFLETGIAIHKKIKDRGFDSDIVVANTLVDMYSKCGSMFHAREVFEEMGMKDAVTWTSLILGYVESGQSCLAIDLFTRMDCKPDSVTYVAALKACAGLAGEKDAAEKELCLEKGIAIHRQVKERGFESDIIVANTLVGMYSKCGSMQHARQVFDRMVTKDVVTWNTLMLGYLENGQSSEAFKLYKRMNCEPSAITVSAALKACGSLANEKESAKQVCLEEGIAIHTQLKDRGFDSDMVVRNSLVGMYSKCGSIQRAREVFDRMVSKDVVSWNSVILGYVENGEAGEALELFSRMECEPNCATYLTALKACGSLAALQAGEQIHTLVCKLGLEQDHMVSTSLMDFYGKCGNLSKAEALFSNMQSPSTITWNALVAGYSAYGDSTRVFNLARRMQEAGFELDSITSVSILTACRHAGLAEGGKRYFDSMSEHGINMSLEHYNCMVDLLGRANRLQDALKLIKSMPFEANSVTWITLLGACKKWKNLEVGKVAFNALVAADTTKAAAYELMSDLYRSLNLWQDMEQVNRDKKSEQALEESRTGLLMEDSQICCSS